MAPILSALAHAGGHHYGAVSAASPSPLWVWFALAVGLALTAWVVRGRLRFVLGGIAVMALIQGCPTEPAGDDDDSAANDDDAVNDDDAANDDDAVDDCAELLATFLDVDGETNNGLTTRLSVTCTDEFLVIESNGAPNHQAGGRPQEHGFVWQIPRTPVALDTPADIITTESAIGVAVNGVPIMEPAAGPEDNRVDPIAVGFARDCGGHNDHNGVFHYHGFPTCLFDENDPDAVVGWAFDGHPMRAPWTCVGDDCDEVEELESSWRTVGDPETDPAWEAHEYTQGHGDLDSCNGRLTDDGYEYRMTSTFPHSIGCWSGERESQLWNSPFDRPPEP